MTEKNKKLRNTNQKKTHRTAVLFWVCLILVLAPFVVLGWILFSASRDTGKPVLGNRYEGDLDPAITEKQMDQVESAVKGLSGQDDAFVTMKTATLRVYVDMPDDATEDQCNAKADEVYNTVAGILDPAVYFTKTDSEKMYDLEIHVYTLPERTDKDGENFVYVIDTKTSGMTDPQKQTVSVAKNQEVADQLRQDVIDREAQASADAAASAAVDNGGDNGAAQEDIQSDDDSQQ